MIDWGCTFIVAALGGVVSLLAAGAWIMWDDFRRHQRLPINQFADTPFPWPGDDGWLVEGEICGIGPVVVAGCRLVCHGYLVEESLRVLAYRDAIRAADRARRLAAALDALQEFEAHRAREMLS